MKILTINWTYGYGSTGKIILDIEHELQDIDFFHCVEYQTLDVAENVYVLTNWLTCRVYNRTSRLKGLQYQNGVLPTNRLLRKISEYKPDIVHIHCPNGHTLNLYRLLNYLKVNRIPTVITNHAEFFYTGNCPHAFECKQYMDGCKNCSDYKLATNSLLFNRSAEAWKKMYQCFRGFNNLRMVCVSDWQSNRLQGSTICAGIPCNVIYNGVDTSVFNVNGYDTFRKKKIVLFVTASFSNDSNDPKGGNYIIALADRIKDRYPDVEFWIAGPDRTNSVKLPCNMAVLGEVTDQARLAELYSNADITIIASRRETFGMTCAESMCCGTPVVGFENGGTESIAIKEFSQFAPYGNVDELEKILLEWINKKQYLDREMWAEHAQKKYSKQTMAQQYYNIYKELLEK